MLVLLDVLQSLEGHFIRGEVRRYLRPLKRMVPLSCFRNPEMVRKRVVLPAPFLTDHDDHFSGTDLKGNIEQHMQFLVGDIEVLDLQILRLFRTVHSHHHLSLFQISCPVSSSIA